MWVRTSDVLEFLRSKGFWRVLDIPILDVPFTHTSWSNSQVEVDVVEDEDFPLADLYLLGLDWGDQEGGKELFIELVAYARSRNLLINHQDLPS